MDYKDLPDNFKEIWEGMDLHEQRALLACLGQNLKPIHYRIKAKAEVSVVAPILLYINKYSIKHKVERRGANVVFTFDSMEERNKVLIGKNTI